MVQTGVVYGRFQVPHLKHLEYILAAKMRCSKLYIGIAYPDEVSGADAAETEEDYRRKKSANPLTYLERFEMLEGAVLDFGVPRTEFDIIPFPIERPESLRWYAPKEATCFLSICDEWTRKNQQVLEQLGLSTEVLWQRESREKGVSGTQIRQRILAGEKWSDLVPRTVYEYLVSRGIEDRIRYSK